MDTTNVYFALHVIGFVAWIAGLLYLGRILVYHSEAYKRKETEKKILIEQFILMEKRVNRFIAFPAMLLTLVMGFIIMSATKSYFFAWFQIKFLLIMIMIGLHLGYGFVFVRFKKNSTAEKSPMSSFTLRIYNEAVTLVFIFIVFAASLKIPSQIFIAWIATFSLFLVAFILMRLKKNKEKS